MKDKEILRNFAKRREDSAPA